jgi:hypothetical protein
MALDGAVHEFHQVRRPLGGCEVNRLADLNAMRSHRADLRYPSAIAVARHSLGRRLRLDCGLDQGIPVWKATVSPTAAGPPPQ